PQHREGGQGHPQAARGDRQGEGTRPDRGGPRGGGAHHRGLRPFDGPGGGGLSMKTTKRVKAQTTIEPGKAYAIDEAVKIIKDNAKAKFVEAVDVAVRLGVDAKKSDQQVRGSTVLPAGTGKSVRVAVFAPAGAKADEALAAGAEAVGMDDLAEKMLAGDLNYDVVIATPDAMRVVGKLGQVLGPRGLMPNPKVGTVSPNPAEAVKAAKGGQVRYRT